jgi:LuxR family quorum sensing-dependent transcriptional regulator
MTQTLFDSDVTAELIDYCMEVERIASVDDVLDRLHEIVSRKSCIRVFGANRFAARRGDWRRIEVGRTVFFHKDVPRGWIEEWADFVANGHPLVGLMTARMCLAPFTWRELWTMLDPVGVDRWPIDLAIKHGMRDGYLCPIGGRWVVGYWSPRVFDPRFTQQARALLYMTAASAAMRLERLVKEDAGRIGQRTGLSPRELAVLRHASEGKTAREIAQALGVGTETVRSHFKNAEAKLGTRNRTQTVAEAMRQLLIL